MYHRKRYAYRATDALLEISEHIFGKGIIKVVRDDKHSRGQAEWTRTADAFHWPDLRNRPIVGGHDQRLAVQDAVENPFGISLDLFDRDVHEVSLTNTASRGAHASPTRSVSCARRSCTSRLLG